MLEVKTPEEVLALIWREFAPITDREETVPFSEAAGRILARDICAKEYVPDFDRSTVDGYACRARDTFGCSDAIPAILNLSGEVLMGQSAGYELKKESCVYVPTGGAIPKGADCAVMIEYTEDYGDGTVGILKPGAPGMNLIFRGDDVFPGKVILRAGRRLTASDIGALAAVGETQVPVRRRLQVGVLSTGDELVPADQKPGPGQVRDVNGPMLAALLRDYGAEAVDYGIAVDVTGFDDVPESRHSCSSSTGKGAAIKVKDSSVICSPAVNKILVDLAEKKKIPYQMDVLTAGGTDTGAMIVTQDGVPSSGISIPCKFCHCPQEIVSADDMEACAKLCAAFAQYVF